MGPRQCLSQCGASLVHCSVWRAGTQVYNLHDAICYDAQEEVGKRWQCMHLLQRRQESGLAAHRYWCWGSIIAFDVLAT